MLVFKRALSLALSAMLACPASAFARNEKSNKQRGFIPSTSAEQRSRTKAVAKRKPANVASRTATPKSVLSTVMPQPQRNRKGYEVVEVKGKNNKLKSRLVTRGDFREFIIDENNDGQADVYEVTQGSLTAKASLPYKGQFTKIEYIKKNKKGYIRSNLILNPKTKGYDLVASSVLPYEINHHADDTKSDEVAQSGGMCADSLSYLNEFNSILDKIKQVVDGGDRTKAMECKVKAFQDVFFDDSCDDGKFKDSKADMMKGLALVLSSHGSAPPTYMQCVQDKGYGYHAFKAQEALIQRLKTVREKLKEKAVFDDAFFENGSCERIEKIDVLKGDGDKTSKKKLKDFLEKEYLQPLFSCSNQGGVYGTHSDKGITLNVSSAQISRPEAYGVSADHAYGSLMMHELLHDAGMGGNDEPLIKQIQNCCAPSKYDSAQKQNSCNYVSRQSRDSAFIAKMRSSVGYYNAVRQLSPLPGMGDKEAEDYLNTLATAYRDLPDGAGAAEIAKFETCSTSAGQDDDKKKACQIAFFNKFAAFAKPYTRDRICPAWQVTKPNIDCASVMSTMEVAIKNPDTIYSRSPISILEPASLDPFNLDSELYRTRFDVMTELPPLPPLAASEPETPSQSPAKVPPQASNDSRSPDKSTNKNPAASGQPTAPAQPGTPATQPGNVASRPTTPNPTQPGAQPGTSAGRTPVQVDENVRVGGSNRPTQQNPAQTQPQPGTTTPEQPSYDDPTGVADNYGNETGGGGNQPSGSTNIGLTGPTGMQGTYYPTSSKPVAAPPQQPTVTAMPVASTQPAANTLGAQNIDFQASPIADRLTSYGNKLMGTISGAIASAPASAKLADAQAIVRSPGVSQTYSGASWAGSSSGGSRTVASSAPSGSGSRASPSSRNASAPTSGKSKSSADEDQMASGSAVAAKADAEEDESNAEAVQAKQAIGAVPVRGLAASAPGGMAQALSPSAWKTGTFRTRFEATKFVTSSPASRIIELSAKPNSAFERDLAKQQIGIQMGGGRVIGYSNPKYQICGQRVVTIGECR